MVNSFYKWCKICCLLLWAITTNVFIVNKANALGVVCSSIFANDLMCKRSAHPFYVTVTEINYNAKDKTLEISCKMFLDDFEKTLSALSKASVDLTNIKDKAKVDKLVSDYIATHLQLKVDGKPVSLQYVGFEKESEAAWCYLQVNNVTSVKKIEIRNTLLFEKFDSQISIMHVTVNGTRKSTRLNKPDAVAKFEF